MSFWSSFKSIFSYIGHGFQSAGSLTLTGLKAAQSSGLTDALLNSAVTWVQIADNKQMSGVQKQSFVSNVLTSTTAGSTSPSITNLAIELALQIVKAKVGA